MKLKGLFGRKRGLKGAEEYEPLSNHLTGVSKLARGFCRKFGAENWGRVVGLFHDAGKCSHDFQLRLQGLLEKVDHATWGGRLLRRKVPGAVGHILASVICGHHGGMPDALRGQSKKETFKAPLAERLSKVLPDIEKRFIAEFESIKIGKLTLPKNPFSRFLFSKMVFSSLVDADRLDSERYNNPDRPPLRKHESITALRKRIEIKMEELFRKENPSEIDKIRTAVQKNCYKMAWVWWNPFSWSKNLFTLTVPTGGGKTFASMLFALRHAEKRHMDRVIYVLPYTTIIEQNAREFRNILGEQNVIEHHCHFEKNSLQYESRFRHKLATENWDAPVIITTNVQFFESLFSSGATRSRKAHNIIRSVIVFDEAHLLPPKLLKPCIRVIKELLTSYRCTAVFCTATQPGLFKDKGFKWGLEEAVELAKDPSRLYRDLERVRYEFKSKIQHDNQMAYLVKRHKKILAVVNTRKHARILYEDIKDKGDAYHLSTLMCVHHRRKVLDEVKARLKSPYPCRLVSTQLVECGVDISFPTVVRNICGVGSIIQAGGRCNREGELGEEKGRLIITNVVGEGHVIKDDFSVPAEEITRKYIRLEKNLLNNETSQQAFVELFHNMEDCLDKPKGAMPLLKLINESGIEIPFETISEIFRIIETSVESIIIPFNVEAMDLIKKLKEDPENFAIARALQAYTVQAYPNDLERIAYAIDDFSAPPYRILADMTLYSNEYGLKVYRSEDLNKARI